MVRFRSVLALAFLLVAGAALLTAEQAKKPSAPAGPTIVVDTAKGQFEIELDQAGAPVSVARILELVKSNFYRGLRVHHVQPGVVELEPLALPVHRLVGSQQLQDRLERLLHPRAELVVVDAHHLRVRHQSTGADAEDAAPAGEVIEEDHPVRHQQRVVVRQRDDPGAETDPVGSLRGGRDHQLSVSGRENLVRDDQRKRCAVPPRDLAGP